MGSLKKEFFHGVLYTGIAKYSSIFIGIFISAILARLLTPSDFGIVAIATVFINFFSTLTTVGISPAIVQDKSINHSDLRSINTFSFLLAFVVTILYLLLVPIILIFYEESESLKNIMYLLAINVFFSIASVVPNALLLKAKMFKFIALRTFLINVSLGIISVISAYCGFGVYALLLSPICGSIIFLFVNFYKQPIGFCSIRKESLSKILSYSLFQMMFNLMYLAYRNIDKLFLGKYFGLSSLGYYEKSYRLMMLPLENVSSIMSPVLHPILSNMQDDKESIWYAYKKMISIISEFSFSISIMLFFFASTLVNLLFGSQWSDSIPIFEILTFSISVQLLQAPLGGVLQSINKVNVLFYGSVIEFIFVLVGVIVGVFFKNLNVFAWGIVIAFILGFIVYQAYIAKCFNKNIREIFSILIPYFVHSILLLAICFPFRNLISNSYIQVIVFCFVFFIYELISIKIGMMPNTKKILYKIINKIKYDN